MDLQKHLPRELKDAEEMARALKRPRSQLKIKRVSKSVREQWHRDAESIVMPAEWPGACEPDWEDAVESRRFVDPIIEVARAKYQIALALVACGRLHVALGAYIIAQQYFNEALLYFSADDLAREARRLVHDRIAEALYEFAQVASPTPEQAAQAAQQLRELGFSPGYYLVTDGYVLGRRDLSAATKKDAIEAADEIVNDPVERHELDDNWQVDGQIDHVLVLKLNKTLAIIHKARANNDEP